MGGRPVVSALKGIGVGIVTPFCTYSAIPMLVGLRRAGVAPAGYVSFIVAAPVLDPVLFGALVFIVGVEAALIYLGVTFSAALGLGMLAQRAGIERHLKPLPASAAAPTSRVPVPALSSTGAADAPACDHTCSVSDTPVWVGLRAEAWDATWSAIGLLRAMGPMLLIGVVIGVAIEILVSSEMVASIAGDESLFAIPIAAALGTPLYFNTELFVPIADSLSAVGVGTCAIVALTIEGAGANLPEFVVLGRLAKPPLLVIFVGYVVMVTVVGGLLAQVVTPG